VSFDVRAARLAIDYQLAVIHAPIKQVIASTLGRDIDLIDSAIGAEA
jgi:hypothetical protein